jgi:hypothetical protein
MASTMGSRDWQFALFDLCVAQAVGAHLEALLLLSLKARPGRVFFPKTTRDWTDLPSAITYNVYGYLDGWHLIQHTSADGKST